MIQAKRYIQFEVSIRSNPFTLVGGLGGSVNSSDTAGDDEYKEVTEDDINELERLLGGGL